MARIEKETIPTVLEVINVNNLLFLMNMPAIYEGKHQKIRMSIPLGNKKCKDAPNPRINIMKKNIDLYPFFSINGVKR